MRRTLSALCVLVLGLLLLSGPGRSEEAQPLPDALALSVEADPEGRVFLLLANPGPETLENVILRERGSGRGRTLRFAPPGVTRVYWPPSANDAGEYEFEAVLPEGVVLSAQGGAPEKAAPAAANALLPEGPSLRMNEAAETYRGMLAAVLLALGAALLAWYLNGRRRKRLERKRRLRKRREKRRDSAGKKKKNGRNGEKTA